MIRGIGGIVTLKPVGPVHGGNSNFGKNSQTDAATRISIKDAKVDAMIDNLAAKYQADQAQKMQQVPTEKRWSVPFNN